MICNNRLFVVGVFLLALSIEQGHCFFWGTRWERSFFVPAIATTNGDDDCRVEATGTNAPTRVQGDFRHDQDFLSNVGLNNTFRVCQVLERRRFGWFGGNTRTSYNYLTGTVGSLLRAIIA
ncbi:hypothetical protein TCAL_15912 [Tigriopus californicus]|uniref:Secreted protein n=1 Tax=Tigriopus californicus TaxID=6832 RepID=A0A553PH01_TIGCA|nr:uncharacterized protein LOC131880452 [Tigriopus californicus]TRY76955.1 hypothetical protein TCAL_15912 [Tigriopus californicus]